MLAGDVRTQEQNHEHHHLRGVEQDQTRTEPESLEQPAVQTISDPGGQLPGAPPTTRCSTRPGQGERVLFLEASGGWKWVGALSRA